MLELWGEKSVNRTGHNRAKHFLRVPKLNRMQNIPSIKLRTQ